MSSEEFLDWMLYYEMSPFGPKRGDIQAAIVARTIAQANAKPGRVFQVKDFLPEFKSRYGQEDRMTNDQIMGFFQNMADAQKKKRH